MVTESKFYKFLRCFPEVQRADQLITKRQKGIYTIVSLFIFLAAGQLPLYGIQNQLQPDTGPDPSCLVRQMLASNPDTLMALGITPILASEMMMQILVASTGINVDSNAPQARTVLNGLQKLVGIFTTIVGAAVYVLQYCAMDKLSTGNAILIMLQLLCSGVVVIYLDDVLKKGYGLFSSVSLFTATHICGNILSKTLSPMSFIYQDQHEEFEGAILAWVHLLITRTDKFSAMREAFCRQNLPNVTSLLATCLFVRIAILFQGLSIVLPIRIPELPGFQINRRIKLSNISYRPIILLHVLVSDLYLSSRGLYMKYGGNKLVNLLGRWNGFNQFGESIPVGGIVYYLTAPQTLADLHRAPLHALVYVSVMLIASTLLTVAWFRVCASSRRLLRGFFALNEQQRILPAQPDSIPPNELVSHAAMAAGFGAFCVGALTILADFIGVFGSGTGIMLAVAGIYPYFDGRAGGANQ
ncbi:hypothetical protein ACP70R_026825 [Stipagrostis hirtigluma subsp. patula]